MAGAADLHAELFHLPGEQGAAPDPGQSVHAGGGHRHQTVQQRVLLSQQERHFLQVSAHAAGLLFMGLGGGEGGHAALRCGSERRCLQRAGITASIERMVSAVGFPRRFSTSRAVLGGMPAANPYFSADQHLCSA